MLSSAQRNDGQQPSGVSFDTVGRNGGVAVGVGTALPLRAGSTVGVPTSGPVPTVVALSRSSADAMAGFSRGAAHSRGRRHPRRLGGGAGRGSGERGQNDYTRCCQHGDRQGSQTYRRSSARPATVSAGSFRIL